MTEFTNKPLTLLDRIYRFVGGVKGVNRMALDRDIQLVHDVSRYVEKNGTGLYHGWGVWQSFISVNGDAGDSFSRPSDIQPFFGFLDEEYEMWVYRVSGYCSDTDQPDFATVSYAIVNTTGSAPFLNNVPGTSYDEISMVGGCVQADLIPVTFNGTTMKYGYTAVLPRPARVCADNILMTYLTSTALCRWDYNWLFWVGPFGCNPPAVP